MDFHCAVFDENRVAEKLKWHSPRQKRRNTNPFHEKIILLFYRLICKTFLKNFLSIHFFPYTRRSVKTNNRIWLNHWPKMGIISKKMFGTSKRSSGQRFRHFSIDFDISAFRDFGNDFGIDFRIFGNGFSSDIGISVTISAYRRRRFGNFGNDFGIEKLSPTSFWVWYPLILIWSMKCSTRFLILVQIHSSGAKGIALLSLHSSNATINHKTIKQVNTIQPCILSKNNDQNMPR